MRETGAITAERERQARAAPLALHPGKAYSSTHESYLTEYISNRLLELYGPERVRRGGLRIYTTLSARMQHTAEAAITAVLDRRGDPAGALVSLDPKTGAIRAMAVAQTGHRLSFNIAANGRRQAGSTFKMFVLTEAIRRGINPWATKYLSAPFTGPHDWKVQTYEHTYSGRIPISQATLASDNTVFARLTLDVGPGRIAELASQMGIRSPLQPVPTVGLGANSISPMDLATAYSTLASGGVLHTPTLLTKVVFPDGTTTQPDKSSSSSVVDPKVAATVTKVLQANVNSGTGTAAALSDRPAAGKTGTTDDYADAWFAGFVPQLSAVVWVGYPDRERPMRDVHGLQVAGGTFPAQIWHGFMERALSGQPPRPFADLGMPAFERWCGRYQFARSTADAKPRNGCPAIEPRAKRKPRKQAPIPTTTAVPTETLPTETTPRQAPPTATHVTTAPATQPSPPPTQTTPPPNTTTYPTEPDATPVVGKEGQVVVDVDADGNGVVRVANRYYRAENADDPQQTMPAGTAVTVVDANGDVADVRAAS
jgi:penicillin-binding protein 1A